MRILAAGLILCSSAFAQSAFEAASVKIAPPSGSTAGRIAISGDRATFTNRTLMQLLSSAYSIGCCDRIKGPSWLSSDRYDIVAKAPSGAPAEKMPEMLQRLLIDRFKLVLHRETRELPTYDLVLGKGRLRLEKAEPSSVKNDWTADGTHRTAKSMNMETLALYVTMMLRTPVIDHTGLDGYYDFSLDTTKEESLNDTFPSIFDLLGDLGLSLNSGKAPFDVLVIDSGNRIPTQD